MATTKCWNCGMIATTKTVAEARRLAVLHMALVGCVMVFGYDKLPV